MFPAINGRTLSEGQPQPMGNFYKLIFFLLLYSTPIYANPIVGIFGDVHGNVEGMESALRQMKSHGVTHIIGTGDFIGWGDATELDGILGMVSVITGVPKENTFLMPGNWEHKASMGPDISNEILKKYGTLISEKYDSYGFVKIGEKVIMVSHFPQHPIPEQYIPPEQFLRRLPDQAFVLDTMKNNVFPPEFVEFEIFAHNHIRAHYVDPNTKKLVVNAGVIDPRTRKPTEERAFAIYDSKTGDVKFYSIETTELITHANTSDRLVTDETVRGLKGCEALRAKFNTL